MRSHSDEPGQVPELQVLKFRPPAARGESSKPADDISGTNVVRLLDLSKYEKPRETTDEFKMRMRENIAALIVLGLLVGIAATDFTDIEQAQRCESVWDCGH